MELSLRNAKTNEKLINSEMDYLRTSIEGLQNKTLPEKDKKIKSLEKEIEKVNILI